MRLENILRRLQTLPGFVYASAEWTGTPKRPAIHVHVRARKGSRALCSKCGKKSSGYDELKPRLFTFVPLWNVPVSLVYAMRRVQCRQCGVTVEKVPWASGKAQHTIAFAWFIANWAKVLSWKECARRFHSSWDTVFRCVEQAVRYGLSHRSLDGIRAIGVDEIAWKKAHKYLTLVYQLDDGHRRLLHIAKERTTASFNSFFDMLGENRSRKLVFVASDMWRAFLKVVRVRCSSAIHVLDRFHVMQLLSKAVDTVRRDEVRALRASGKNVQLTKTRWLLLKNHNNLKRHERGRLRALLTINLRSVRAYLLKEQFRHFWNYRSSVWAEKFLAKWITMAMRSKLPPFKKFAKTLRAHRRELLNWFMARWLFAHGATEGFNNKARITTRKAYGFRTYEHAEIALYHALGDLPEPSELTHRFC